MKPGRELDALVAEKVIGWRRVPMVRMDGSAYTAWQRTYPSRPNEWFGCSLPEFSTDISAAWEVLGEIHRRGIIWCIEQADDCDFATVHIVNPTPCEKEKGHVHFIDEMEKISESAESTPHAICLAALKAIGVKLSE